MNRPMNPFDPNGRPFDMIAPDLPPRPASSFRGNGRLDIGPGPVYYTGWVKFFRFLFDDKTKKGPRAFYENPEYVNQFKRFKSPDEVSEKEDGQWKHPHTKNDFYVMAYKDELSFAQTKEKFFDQLFDTLKIEFIKPVSEDQGFKGGISNMGSFKEGECFKVTTSQAGRWSWVICTETAPEKIKLMSAMKSLIIKKQRENGHVNIGNNPGVDNKYYPGARNHTTINGATLDPETHGVSFEKNLLDGYWITLQDWSSCTKFCGGGTQTLHRMCVPPKKGGAPCEGQAQVNRTCNEQHCPRSHELDLPEKTNKTVETLKPILSVLPFSDRPQRYDKCHLKESDLLLTTEYEGEPDIQHGMKVKAIQIPVRVVMNRYTIAAYAGLNETDKRISFDLKKVNFFSSQRDPTCFELKEYGVREGGRTTEMRRLNAKAEISKAELCPFGANGNPDIKEEWDYDFNLFKNQCFEAKKINAVINETEIEEELGKKKGQMRLDMINEKKKKMIHDKEQDHTYTKKVKDQSLQAIQKELKLEELVENELKEAQGEAIEMKAKELEKEKYKLDCLNKAIKEKELENEYNIAQVQRKDRVDGIKKHVVDTIKVKRARLKSKLAKLKKLSTNQLSNMDAQIMNIRVEMMNSLNTEQGSNPSKCRLLVQNKNEDLYQKARRAYCDERMADDPDDHQRCVMATREDLIHLCCDYETNPENPQEYQRCIDETNKVVTGSSYDDVRFFWAKPYHRMIADDTQQQFINHSSGMNTWGSSNSSMNRSSMSSSSMNMSSSSSSNMSSSSSGGMSMSMSGK